MVKSQPLESTLGPELNVKLLYLLGPWPTRCWAGSVNLSGWLRFQQVLRLAYHRTSPFSLQPRRWEHAAHAGTHEASGPEVVFAHLV